MPVLRQLVVGLPFLVACARPAAPVAPAPPAPITNAEPTLADTPVPDSNPRTARIVKVEDVQGDTFITVARGSNEGLYKDWHACVVDGGTTCLAGGELIVIRVEEQTFFARTTLTAAQLQAHPVVLVWPPD